MAKSTITFGAVLIAVISMAAKFESADHLKKMLQYLKPVTENRHVLQHDRGDSGRSPADTNANPGKEKWEFVDDEEGAGEFSAPVIGPDGTIYFASDELWALKPNGRLSWKVEIGGFRSSPAIGADGMIYVAGNEDDDTWLFAVSPRGTLKWRFATGQDNNETVSAPVVGAGGTIYFASSIDTTNHTVPTARLR